MEGPNRGNVKVAVLVIFDQQNTINTFIVIYQNQFFS